MPIYSISNDIAAAAANTSTVDIIIDWGANDLRGTLILLETNDVGVNKYQFNTNNLPNTSTDALSKLRYHRIFINNKNYFVVEAALSENNPTTVGLVFYSKDILPLTYFSGVGIHLGVRNVKIIATPLDTDNNAIVSQKIEFNFSLDTSISDTRRIITVPIVPKYQMQIIPTKNGTLLPGISGAVVEYDLTKSEPATSVTITRTPENLRVAINDDNWVSSTCWQYGWYRGASLPEDFWDETPATLIDYHMAHASRKTFDIRIDTEDPVVFAMRPILGTLISGTPQIYNVDSVISAPAKPFGLRQIGISSQPRMITGAGTQGTSYEILSQQIRNNPKLFIKFGINVYDEPTTISQVGPTSFKASFIQTSWDFDDSEWERAVGHYVYVDETYEYLITAFAKNGSNYTVTFTVNNATEFLEYLNGIPVGTDPRVTIHNKANYYEIRFYGYIYNDQGVEELDDEHPYVYIFNRYNSSTQSVNNTPFEMFEVPLSVGAKFEVLATPHYMVKSQYGTTIDLVGETEQLNNYIPQLPYLTNQNAVFTFTPIPRNTAGTINLPRTISADMQVELVSGWNGFETIEWGWTTDGVIPENFRQTATFRVGEYAPPWDNTPGIPVDNTYIFKIEDIPVDSDIKIALRPLICGIVVGNVKTFDIATLKSPSVTNLRVTNAPDSWYNRALEIAAISLAYDKKLEELNNKKEQLYKKTLAYETKLAWYTNEYNTLRFTQLFWKYRAGGRWRWGNWYTNFSFLRLHLIETGHQAEADGMFGVTGKLLVAPGSTSPNPDRTIYKLRYNRDVGGTKYLIEYVYYDYPNNPPWQNAINFLNSLLVEGSNDLRMGFNPPTNDFRTNTRWLDVIIEPGRAGTNSTTTTLLGYYRNYVAWLYDNYRDYILPLQEQIYTLLGEVKTLEDDLRDLEPPEDVLSDLNTLYGGNGEGDTATLSNILKTHPLSVSWNYPTLVAGAPDVAEFIVYAIMYPKLNKPVFFVGTPPYNYTAASLNNGTINDDSVNMNNFENIDDETFVVVAQLKNSYDTVNKKFIQNTARTSFLQYFSIGIPHIAFVVYTKNTVGVYSDPVYTNAGDAWPYNYLGVFKGQVSLPDPSLYTSNPNPGN